MNDEIKVLNLEAFFGKFLYIEITTEFCSHLNFLRANVICSFINNTPMCPPSFLNLSSINIHFKSIFGSRNMMRNI